MADRRKLTNGCTIAWNELLQTVVSAFPRPLLVTLSNAVKPTQVQRHPQGREDSSPTDAAPVATLKQSVGARTTSDFVYSDIGPQAQAAFTNHPHPVYAQTEPYQFRNTNCSIPPHRTPLYYALASSTVYYVPKAPDASPVTASSMLFDALLSDRDPSGYTLQLLCSHAHAQSTFVLPLSRHLQDVVQSFVDLQVLARERWSFSESDGRDVAILPWHIAATSMLSEYDMGSLQL